VSGEKLSQSEIDLLTQTFHSGSDYNALEDEQAKIDRHRKLYKELQRAIKRYFTAMENGYSFEVVNEARRNMHHYAFKNWLEHRGMDRQQYYALIRKEMKKRGMRQGFQSSFQVI